ncbi:proteoglycan 4 isoform X2 [Drosophila rhopaloa]|uniref:Proteoglycan 4 isoform X2 n=1 Tax=Drosophila rhopaloa TaxID=1041015 RepID=A0A6P4F786_DRORH|nr:proteoglycan 4 isoform X2 [Drosophila rhopaloa]
MWEKLVNCMKGNGGAQKKSCQVIQLADLVKQVPPNQMKMFQMFSKKHEEYKDRVRKYPESMPTIDWDYYRQNVREEFVDWVKGYETKYDKMHSLFENRHAMVDHKRYFDQVDAEAEEVKKEISAYKAASNERIKKLSEQMEFAKGMHPYNNMTMEEFCFARPHLAPDFINKPTFWPHTPEEQTPGPSDPAAAAALHEDHEPEPPKKPTPSLDKPPEKGSGDGKTATAVATKKPAEPVVDTTQLAEKASGLAKDLVAKAIVLFNTLKEKLSGLAKNVQKKAEAAKAARAEAAGKSKTETETSTSTATPTKSLDSIRERESGSNICNQTIIRSEEGEANPEVKARHANLSIEAEPCDAQEERAREIARTLERKRQLQEAEEWGGRKKDPCKPKPDPCKEEEDVYEPDPCKQKEEEDVCEPDPCKLGEVCEPDPCKPDPCKTDLCKPDPCKPDPCKPDPCKPKYEDVCKPDPCKPKDEETICEDEEDPCKKKPKDENDWGSDMESESGSESSKEQEQIFINIAECSKELARKEEKKSGEPGKPKEKASLTETVEGTGQKPIIGLHHSESKDAKKDQKGKIEGASEVGPVYTDPKQIVELLEKDKEAKELKEREESAKIQEAKKPADDDIKESPKDMAKQVFNMATGAASLLTEAANTLEDLKKKKEERLEALEQAYTSAQRQAQGALAEASKAVEAANKLAQRAAEQTGEISSRDQEALDMAEKHAILAKMLASRAVALKDEIARVLNDLKKKQ